MSGIEHEIERLRELAASGSLPGYPDREEENSFFAQKTSAGDLREYSSDENDALEHALETLWANDPSMRSCIPLILAAVEKSRGQESHALVQTELYNYTM